MLMSSFLLTLRLHMQHTAHLQDPKKSLEEAEKRRAKLLESRREKVRNSVVLLAFGQKSL